MKQVLFSLLVLMGSMSMAIGQSLVSGVVTDNSGETLIGASVVVKEFPAIGTITDIDGRYSLRVPEGGETLVFSYTGHTSQEVAIGGQSSINVSLAAGQVLSEVVITALGISKESKSLGYAVQGLSNEEIQLTGNKDLLGAMQGKLAGVDIKPSSGMPGASTQFVIRGARSFTGNNTPLFVIDGMPISSTSTFSTGNSVTGSDIGGRALDIDPADIESIDILKGQSASALYGIRASNGVVVITTKSGKGLSVGKPVISFSHNSTFDQVSRNPDYQTTYAQGSYGAYVPNASFSWGPKIVDLPNDPSYGGNTDNAYTKQYGLQQGKFYVPQLAQAGLDPWRTPEVFNNWKDYFQTGYTNSNNLNVSQATQNGN